MSKREKPVKLLSHFEDADGHVVTPSQWSARPGSEFWGLPKKIDALNSPTRYSPCRVGVTVGRLQDMDPKEASRIQRDEIAHEVPCWFEGDESGPLAPCYKCGRRPPPGCGWSDEEEFAEAPL